MASLPGDMSFEDADLVRKVQAGDVASFAGLVLKYQDRVYNVCLRMSGHAEEARDLAQETFVRAFDGIGRFEHKSGFYTWLFRIAANLALSWRRKERRMRLTSLNGQEDDSGLQAGSNDGDQAVNLRVAGRRAQGEGPPEELRRKETQQAVADALVQLDDDQRIVLVLREIEELDYQAIAEVLGLPIGTVRSRLHRARLAMRDLLKPMMENVG